MTNARDDLEHAAELLGRLVPMTTPGPWRDSSVEGNRYHALVSPEPHPWRRPGAGWDYDAAYGGCLVGESMVATDRRLMAVMRNVANDLRELLEAVAHEDPIQVSRIARVMAREIIDVHVPTNWPPRDDPTW